MSFEQHFKGFGSYILTFQYFGFLMNFRDFRVFVFWCRVYNENPEITKNLYFLVYNTPMHVIYSEGSKAFKTQLAAAMWLNHCGFDVIWTAFQGFLKLRTHILVFWAFWWVSLISTFSFLSIGLKTKTWKSRKIFNFESIMFKWMWIYFLISISTFWELKLK